MRYKKIAPCLITALSVFNSNSTFSGSMETINSDFNWTGFYLGGNAGYWGTQSNNITTTSSSDSINQTFSLGASNITNALAQLATNNFSLHSYGFIGGGQVGYNYQYSKGILLGIDTDLNGLSNSDNDFLLKKAINLVDFNEAYLGSLAIKQQINYLGSLRARLGYLYNPTFLIYGAGGFTYGSITLNTSWTANESLGPAVYPAIVTQNNQNKILTGWNAGGGIEWLFKPSWSAKIEYTCHFLSNLNSSSTLSQINSAESPPILWGSTAAKTALSLSVGAIRVGINYHFT